MIKNFFLSLMIILGWSAKVLAQNAFELNERNPVATGMSVLSYTFQLDSATYTPLSNPISLNNSSVWGFGSSFVFPSIPSPFPAAISGTNFNSIYFSPEFGAGNPNLTTMYNGHWAVPFGWIGLVDRGFSIDTSLSPVSYQVEGAVGNRIIKFEAKEVGSRHEQAVNPGILVNYVSFQVWLYENSQVIEFRYGPSVMPSDSIFYGENQGVQNTGPIVGIFNETPNDWVECWLQGPVGSPSLVSTAQFMIGTPANGTIYRFNPVSTTSVAEQQLSSQLKAFPNPATDLLQLQLQNNQASALVQLYDLSGREVKRVLMSEMQTTLDISDLAAGMYNLRMKGAAGSLKIIKK
jgi:hypothetical protein